MNMYELLAEKCICLADVSLKASSLENLPCKTDLYESIMFEQTKKLKELTEFMFNYLPIFSKDCLGVDLSKKLNPLYDEKIDEEWRILADRWAEYLYNTEIKE